MSALVFAVCEARIGESWYEVASFEHGSGRHLLALLDEATLSGRGWPPEPGAGARAGQEEAQAFGATFLTGPELAVLAAADDDPITLPAWQAFARVYEDAGAAVRVVLWFV
ncbi:hypothetical protein [Deinococcus puniceus]|uniref:Uncharacterized protein n=1 Tax=Deinococcus puniceus TaxID=1182568 RepID=A0A172TB67_9DEIO|nr:hypothetical protein [Deinococcus puniceus]ANE44174.1 hypothetical protein SU48_10790 [Deinococcus puniceus]